MLTTKRALAFALLAYIATFIAAIVSSVALRYDLAQIATSPPLDYCIAIIVASTIAALVVTYLYFTYKSPKIKAGAKHGFKFGVTMIVLGLVLDMLFFLPFVISQGNIQQIGDSYGQAYIYLVFVGVLAASTGVGYWLEKNPKK